MVDTREVLDGLGPATQDLTEAGARTAGAAAFAEAVRENLLGHGWDGVAAGMDEVIAHLHEARTSVDAAVGAAAAAEVPVAEITESMSPEEVEERLRTAAQRIGETSAAIETGDSALDWAKDTVERVLRGGDPAPLLGQIDDVQRILNAARTALAAAAAKTDGEIVEVARAGNR